MAGDQSLNGKAELLRKMREFGPECEDAASIQNMIDEVRAAWDATICLPPEPHDEIRVQTIQRFQNVILQNTVQANRNIGSMLREGTIKDLQARSEAQTKFTRQKPQEVLVCAHKPVKTTGGKADPTELNNCREAKLLLEAKVNGSNVGGIIYRGLDPGQKQVYERF